MIKASSALLLCLTLNVYHEAGAESAKGKQAVAHVTINRSKHKSKRDLCDVVYKPHQFSWTKSKHSHPDKSSKTWILSYKIAKDVLSGKVKDPTNGATYFHALHVAPLWADRFKKTTKIGNHVFYKPHKQGKK